MSFINDIINYFKDKPSKEEVIYDERVNLHKEEAKNCLCHSCRYKMSFYGCEDGGAPVCGNHCNRNTVGKRVDGGRWRPAFYPLTCDVVHYCHMHSNEVDKYRKILLDGVIQGVLELPQADKIFKERFREPLVEKPKDKYKIKGTK